jgi:hypothetical protein
MFPAVLGLGVLLLFAMAGRKRKAPPAVTLTPLGPAPPPPPVGPPPAFEGAIASAEVHPGGVPSGPEFPEPTMPGGAPPPPPSYAADIQGVANDGEAVIQRAFANCADVWIDQNTYAPDLLGLHADTFHRGIMLAQQNNDIAAARRAYENLRGAVTALGCQ